MKAKVKRTKTAKKPRMPSPQEIACWAIAYVSLREERKPRNRDIAYCYARLREVVHRVKGAL